MNERVKDLIKNWRNQDETIGGSCENPNFCCHGICADELEALLAEPQEAPIVFDLRSHLVHQREWSEQTFGPGERAKGVVEHIRKELREIEENPSDLEEWIDVVILALDGAWRSGATPDEIIGTLVGKQAKNEKREWPDWRTFTEGQAIEHVKATTPPATEPQEAPKGHNCPSEPPVPPAENWEPHPGQYVWVEGKLTENQPQSFANGLRVYIHGVGTGIAKVVKPVVEQSAPATEPQEAPKGGWECTCVPITVEAGDASWPDHDSTQCMIHGSDPAEAYATPPAIEPQEAPRDKPTSKDLEGWPKSSGRDWHSSDPRFKRYSAGAGKSGADPTQINSHMPQGEVAAAVPSSKVPDASSGFSGRTPPATEPAADLVESLAAKFHDIYQREAKRQGDVRHKDSYADLPENIKEFDRVLARYVATEFQRIKDEALEEAAKECESWGDQCCGGSGQEICPSGPSKGQKYGQAYYNLAAKIRALKGKP